MKNLTVIIILLLFSNLLPQKLPVTAIFDVDARAMKSKINVLGVNPIGFEIEFVITVEVIDIMTKQVLGRWGDKGTPPGFSKASIWNKFDWPIAMADINLPKDCKKVEIKYLIFANVSKVELGLDKMFNCKFAGIQGAKSISTNNWMFGKKKELDFGKIHVKLECKN